MKTPTRTIILSVLTSLAFVIWGLVFSMLESSIMFAICIICAIGVLLRLPIIFFINQKKDKAFHAWLKEQNFTVSKISGGLRIIGMKTMSAFVVDSKNKKWCKFPVQAIFNFADITQTDIHTNGASVSHGFGSANFRNGNRAITSSTSKTVDISTYEVYIQKRSVETPLVIIPCGRSYASAQEICSYINSLKDPADKSEIKFIYCKHCGSKNLSSETKCSGCNANL